MRQSARTVVKNYKPVFKYNRVLFCDCGMLAEKLHDSYNGLVI